MRAAAALLVWLIFAAEAFAAIAFVADGGYGVGTTSVVLTKPAGTASGNLLIACISDINSAAAVTPPSGWNLIVQSGPSVDPVFVFAYYKLAGGSEPANYTFSDAAATDMGGNARAYSGTKLATPFINSSAQKSDTAGGSTVITVPALSESFVSGERYVGCSIDWENLSVSSTSPTLGNVFYNSGGASDALYMADYLPGSTPGAQSFTWGGSGGGHSALGFSVLPAANATLGLTLTGAGR